jgi:thiol-disulfide isomerase/thioredoxin
MSEHFQYLRNPRTEEFLHKVATQNSNPPVRAQALFTLAHIDQIRAQMTVDLKEKGPEFSNRLRLTMTPDQFENLQKADPSALSAEAEKLYERVADEFAVIPVPNSNSRLTFGDQAKAALLEMRGLAVGQPAPELESVDMEGVGAKLSQYRGKVVVLDVWATWCGPCRQMIPHERELVKRMEGKPFALISVSVDAGKDTLKNFLQKEPMPWIHWWNGAKGGIIDQWNIHSYPTIFVLDAKGTIRFKDKRGAELDEAVNQLIKETAVQN